MSTAATGVPVSPSALEPLQEDGGPQALLATLAARTLAGGGWALATLAVGLGLGIARTLVVARLLGAREMGVMGMALLTVGMVEAFTTTGLESALVSQPGDVRDDLDSAFAISAVRGVLITVLLWAAAPLAAAAFGTPEAAPVIRAVALTALLRSLANPAAPLLVKGIEFRRLFWWSLPGAVAGFALAVGVARVRPDVWALVAGAVGAEAVATAASYAMLPHRPGLGVRREGVRRLLHYGKWVSGARVLAWVSLSADNAVVGRFLGAGALGLYQVAFRVGELAVVTVTHAVVRVALPALAQLRASGQLARGFRAALGVALAANCAFAAGVLLWGGPLLARLLGPAWLPAVPVLRILVVAMVFRSVVAICGGLFEAVRRPSITARVNAVRLAVMLATIFPLMHRFGMEGVAGSVLLASAAAAALSLQRIRTLLRAPLPS
ncbi:MAG TPA: oligosaccharide flippase family protein [Longimicrobium sp.]|nr:oligosaccharide flippase family protein [Longimicrobium sp.]